MRNGTERAGGGECLDPLGEKFRRGCSMIGNAGLVLCSRRIERASSLSASHHPFRDVQKETMGVDLQRQGVGAPSSSGCAPTPTYWVGTISPETEVGRSGIPTRLPRGRVHTWARFMPGLCKATCRTPTLSYMFEQVMFQVMNDATGCIHDYMLTQTYSLVCTIAAVRHAQGWITAVSLSAF